MARSGTVSMKMSPSILQLCFFICSSHFPTLTSIGQLFAHKFLVLFYPSGCLVHDLVTGKPKNVSAPARYGFLVEPYLAPLPT